MSKWFSLSNRFKLSSRSAVLGLTLLGLASAALGLVAAQATWGFIALAVLMVLVLVLAFMGMGSETHLLGQIEKVLSEASQGKLESRIINIPAGQPLTASAWGVNELLDQVEAVFRESLTVVNRMGEGDFSREPQQAGLKGIFPVILGRIADVQTRVHHTVSSLREIMTALAKGQFDKRVQISGEQGEYKLILENAQQAITALDSVLSEVVSVMGEMSRGNLTPRVNANGEGSLAMLKNNINETLAALSQAMASINTNARQVASASSETSSAIGQISDGAQNQTHAISQVSTAVRQTVTSVAEVSRSTEAASQKSRGAVTVVRNSMTKMDEMVKVVNNIAINSEKINKITEVIEKIANKTNLLSLNAAIEAARAGEHGKGFAVVADEVGKLAVSSAESSKEIAVLVEQAVKEANQAVQAVTAVNEDMSNIERGSQETDQMLQRIAAALEQQSSAMEEINANVASVDRIAQSNAAASEEITATVVELSKIANATRQEVEKFSF
jgi:methyl-accepting chemotaxis protein